ncbi:MAG: DNA-directed RNA polymerase subunit M [Thermoprotei archaeon]|nr:MAG: DNA-directed RNA polymerase subunit M [Thermoprotei archaeon]RLF17950.1 MAG: DNA-directed RNA polymerase subunit M [Thermoprotei archaeon]
MEFCPKCGKLLVPAASKDGEVVLACRVCGYTKPISKSQKGYVWTEKIDDSKRRRTAVIEGSPTLEKQRKEERELAQEYYEIFLESFNEAAEEEG